MTNYDVDDVAVNERVALIAPSHNMTESEYVRKLLRNVLDAGLMKTKTPVDNDSHNIWADDPIPGIKNHARTNETQ